MSDEQKLTDFGTARARAGYLINDTLWYVTGGVAWGTVKNDFAVTNSALPAPFPLPAIFGGAGSFSHRQAGWTIGGGVESRLWGSAWSLKLEYLYVDLRSETDAFGLAVNPAFVANNPTAFAGLVAGVTSNTHFTDNVIRVGLNYKFGNFYAPVVAK
jgi:outer membrane immunogenic protein